MEEELRPIRRLMAATIILALKDLNRKDKKIRKNAEDWFNERSRKPFGFYYCLEHSGLNPNIIQLIIKDRNLIKNLS